MRVVRVVRRAGKAGMPLSSEGRWCYDYFEELMLWHYKYTSVGASSPRGMCDAYRGETRRK